MEFEDVRDILYHQENKYILLICSWMCRKIFFRIWWNKLEQWPEIAKISKTNEFRPYEIRIVQILSEGTLTVEYSFATLRQKGLQQIPIICYIANLFK